MAEVFITKQLRPAASVVTALYTVPALTRTLVSTILVCNDSAIDTTYQITHAIGGAADSAVQRVFSGLTLSANATDGATVGGTLNAGDVIRVLSVSGNVNFHLYGVEKT